MECVSAVSKESEDEFIGMEKDERMFFSVLLHEEKKKHTELKIE